MHSPKKFSSLPCTIGNSFTILLDVAPTEGYK
jgi:hypothetical protein